MSERANLRDNHRSLSLSLSGSVARLQSSSIDAELPEAEDSSTRSDRLHQSSSLSASNAAVSASEPELAVTGQKRRLIELYPSQSSDSCLSVSTKPSGLTGPSQSPATTALPPSRRSTKETKNRQERALRHAVSSKINALADELGLRQTRRKDKLKVLQLALDTIKKLRGDLKLQSCLPTPGPVSQPPLGRSRATTTHQTLPTSAPAPQIQLQRETFERQSAAPDVDRTSVKLSAFRPQLGGAFDSRALNVPGNEVHPLFPPIASRLENHRPSLQLGSTTRQIGLTLPGSDLLGSVFNCNHLESSRTRPTEHLGFTTDVRSQKGSSASNTLPSFPNACPPPRPVHQWSLEPVLRTYSISNEPSELSTGYDGSSSKIDGLESLRNRPSELEVPQTMIKPSVFSGQSVSSESVPLVRNVAYTTHLSNSWSPLSLSNQFYGYPLVSTHNVNDSEALLPSRGNLNRFETPPAYPSELSAAKIDLRGNLQSVSTALSSQSAVFSQSWPSLSTRSTDADSRQIPVSTRDLLSSLPMMPQGTTAAGPYRTDAVVTTRDVMEKWR